MFKKIVSTYMDRFTIGVTGPTSVDERRISDRAFLTVAVTVEIGDRIIRGVECRNISTTGMFVFMDNDVPEGAQGTVTLTKKCGSRRYSFSADFEVIRKTVHKKYGSGVGVKFIRIFDEDQKSLAYIVEYHLALMFREKLEITEENLDGITFRIAQTKEELEQAFSIVHDMYVKELYMDKQPHGMRISLYYSLPFTTTFVGVKDDKVIVACTLFLDSTYGLPMDDLYVKELELLRKNHRLIAEIGAFAVRPGYKNISANIVMHLQKMIFHYTLKYFNLDDLTITINPKHRMYYQYVMLFDQIGDEKMYQKVNGNPAIAMHLNLRTAERAFRESYGNLPFERNIHHFFYQSKSNCIEWPKHHTPVIVWNQELLKYFFEEKTDIFKNTDQAKLEEILKFYK